MIDLICKIAFIAQIAAFCGPDTGPVFAGYVEGDYTRIAPIEASRIIDVHVGRGDRVTKGQLIADMEKDDAKLAVDNARASVAEAEARYADLKLGKRPEEIAAIEASLRSAEAQAKQASATFERQKQLYQRGHASKAQLDDAEANHDVAKAKVGEIEANLAVARLPARKEEIKAADERLSQARSNLETALWKLEQRRLLAPANGRIFDVLRRSGEIASPESAVVSMLADGAIKLRFYVPEESIADIKTGTKLSVGCDGCPNDLTATVSYVAAEPEFTPPVIYSIETRQKLVYLVEARPPEGDDRLRPGQIIDVRLADRKTAEAPR
ncbi:HlyD family secretion protein [Rhodobium orientis]|nr:HlyD family secretion protein [Rhodobium orientis]